MKILRYLALTGLVVYGLSLFAMKAQEPEDTVEEIQKMSTSDLQDYMKEVLAFAATISNRSDQQDYLKEVNQKLRDAGKLNPSPSTAKGGPSASEKPASSSEADIIAKLIAENFPSLEADIQAAVDEAKQKVLFEKLTAAMTAKLEDLSKTKPANAVYLAAQIQHQLYELAQQIFKKSENAVWAEEHPFKIWNDSIYELFKKNILGDIKEEQKAFYTKIKELRDAEVNAPKTITWLARAEYTAQAIKELKSKAELLRNAISKMPAEGFFGAKSPEKQKLEAQLDLIKDTITKYARAGLAGYMNDYMQQVEKADEAKYNELLNQLTQAAKEGYSILGGYVTPKTDTYSASAK